MSQRDSGWIQIYAETNQEAADLHVQAFKIAEELSLPVMVCMDGFILTHAYERVDIPEQDQVDKFLPPFKPRQVLDPSNPVSIGAMVGPEAFTEVKYMAHKKTQLAIEVIPRVANEFQEVFGRSTGGLIRGYKLDGAQTVVIALGSVLGTIKDVVDEMVAADIAIGVLGIIAFRPFPTEAVRAALSHAKRVIVLEKAFQVGIGGIVIENVRASLRGTETKDYTLIAGLGGRPITKQSLRQFLDQACVDGVDELTFLDLDQELADSEIVREGGK